MGEVVLRDLLAERGIDDVVVTSAGVSAEESGNRIDRRARAVLEEFGHAAPANHHAHRATAKELREADLVLAMTTGHARSLRSMMNELGVDTQKLHLWREFDGTVDVAPGGVFAEGGTLGSNSPLEGGGSLEGEASKRSRSADFYTSGGDFDVPDPWYGTKEDFYDTYDVVKAGSEGIAAFITNQR